MMVGFHGNQFSITMSNMLYHYLMVCYMANDRENINYAVKLILLLVKTPKKSLQFTRDDANTVYMGLPWIVAHYFKGDIDEALKHEDYHYVIEYIRFPHVKKRKDEGMYLDSTYITHTTVLAYGYMSEMTKMSQPLIGFDEQMRNFILDWRRAIRILFHPTLIYGPIGFLSRDKRLTAPTNVDSRLGIQVIPTCLFIRMYDNDYSFACRGQNEWISYYEADATYSTLAQYWVMYRGVRFKDKKSHEIKFPDVGFIYPKYLTAAKTELTKEHIIIASQQLTTDTWIPEKLTGADKPLAYGFVFAFKNIGIMRHFYRCKNLAYGEKYTIEKYKRPAMKNDYGRFTADELIICDSDKHTVKIFIRIEKEEPYDMILFADKETEWIAQQPIMGIWSYEWDCRQKKITKNNFKTLSSSAGVIEAEYPEGITVVNSDNNETVILMENEKPMIAVSGC